MHLLGDAVHVMQQRYQPGRHDHVAAVQRWAFARDLPDGVLRNAASGESIVDADPSRFAERLNDLTNQPAHVFRSAALSAEPPNQWPGRADGSRQLLHPASD